MTHATSLNVSKKIDPADHMWNSGQKWYFEVGQSGLNIIRKILALSWNQKVTSILDLPCGHGRVGRFLRAAYPEAQMTFCDIDTKGVEFCVKEFGGTALFSEPELSNVIFTEPFDLIWVGSLFTHVDSQRTERWLHHLSKALAPNGVLVATFHGRWSIEVQAKYAPMIDDNSWQTVIRQYKLDGFGYAPYPDKIKENYGISLSRISKIVEMVERIEGVRMLAYVERGWADNHDVLGIAKTDRLLAWTS